MEAITDLFEILGALLTRGAVLSQLLVIAGVLAAAAALSRLIIKRLPVFTQATQSPNARSSEDEKLRLVAVVRHVGREIILPVMAIVFAYVALLIFRGQGLTSGLLEKVIDLLWLFLAYRVAMGVLLGVGNERKMRYYRSLLFGPVFALIVFFSLLNEPVSLDALGKEPLLKINDVEITVRAMTLVAFGFPLWVVATGAFTDLVKWLFGRGRDLEYASALQASLTLLRYFLVILGAALALLLLGANTATIAAISGGLSIGVGFALQDVIKNFLGGVLIMLEGSVRPGDWVQIGTIEGRVTNVNIRSTIIRTHRNIEHIVPNQQWLSSSVANFTRSARNVQLIVKTQCLPGIDAGEALKAIKAAAQKHPDVLHNLAPKATLTLITPQLLELTVSAWVADAEKLDRVEPEVRALVWEALRAIGSLPPPPPPPHPAPPPPESKT